MNFSELIRKYICFGIVFFLSYEINGQNLAEDYISGDWQGVLKQNETSVSFNYAYWVSFTVKGDSVFGIARTEVASSPFYALVNVIGSINNNKITFLQDKILKHNTRPNFGWCLIRGELIFDTKENYLYGNWYSDMNNCYPGSLLLFKTNKPLNLNATLVTKYAGFEEIESKLINNELVEGYKVILSKITFKKNSYKIQGGAQC